MHPASTHAPQFFESGGGPRRRLIKRVRAITEALNHALDRLLKDVPPLTARQVRHSHEQLENTDRGNG